MGRKPRIWTAADRDYEALRIGICCFLTMRLLMTWLTADSVNAVEMASPAFRPRRWR
jgi:hypothetical protein